MTDEKKFELSIRVLDFDTHAVKIKGEILNVTDDETLDIMAMVISEMINSYDASEKEIIMDSFKKAVLAYTT